MYVYKVPSTEQVFSHPCNNMSSSYNSDSLIFYLVPEIGLYKSYIFDFGFSL